MSTSFSLLLHGVLIVIVEQRAHELTVADLSALYFEVIHGKHLDVTSENLRAVVISAPYFAGWSLQPRKQAKSR